MDGCPLGLGLVVEDKPTEFSCICFRVQLFYARDKSVKTEQINSSKNSSYKKQEGLSKF